MAPWAFAEGSALLEMGYRGVLSLADHIGGRAVPEKVDSGVALVTPENMQAPEIQALLYPPLAEYLEQ